jgi:hypothetical protein
MPFTMLYVSKPVPMYNDEKKGFKQNNDWTISKVILSLHTFVSYVCIYVVS